MNFPFPRSVAQNPTGYTEWRKTGIGVLGDMPWGSHFFLFYETKVDLLDALVPYFKVGLENNEFCTWVVAEPLTEEDVREALSRAIPQFDRYLTGGDIEILSGRDFYLSGDQLELEKALQTWNDKLDRALRLGYDGVRASGSSSWLERKDWHAFCEYEKQLNSTISGKRMTVLCAYLLAGSTVADILDVTRNHQFAIARRNGSWEVVETSEVKQAKAAIKKLNEELEQRATELEKELSQRLGDAQDAERRRLAVALHDSAGQLLVALQWKMLPFERALAAQNPELSKLAKDAILLLNELSRELRTVSHLLHPPFLDEAGLSAALRGYVEGLTERSGLHVQLELDPKMGRLPRHTETVVFRIVQESLTNIHRYAQTKAATVRISQEPQSIRVEIQDQGRGIPNFTSLNDATFKSGVGIRGMRERVEQLKGKFDLRSGKEGTIVTALLPIEVTPNESRITGQDVA